MTQWIRRGLLVSVLWTSLVSAQGLPVIDSANLVPNTIAATQSVISATQAVIHTAKWIIDQTPLETFVMGAEWAEDLATLQALAQEAQSLGYDLAQLRALSTGLFSLENAPDNSREFALTMQEMRQHISTGWGYALRTQSLILTAQRTITHALALYDQLQGLLGNLGGQQNLSQQLAKLVQLSAEAKTSANAFQLAQSMDHLRGPWMEETMHKLNESSMKGYGQ